MHNPRITEGNGEDGVIEAVLGYISSDKSASTLRFIAFNGVRGMEGVKETNIHFRGNELKIAMVSGLKNAVELLQRIKSGTHYDFVEVMACPGGCISGAGQPFTSIAGKNSAPIPSILQQNSVISNGLKKIRYCRFFMRVC